MTKREVWFDHISKWESSKSTQIGYCKNHQLNLEQFKYHRRLQLKSKKTFKAPYSFIPVNVPVEAPPVCFYKIQYPYGVFIEVGSDIEKRALKKLITCLD